MKKYIKNIINTARIAACKIRANLMNKAAVKLTAKTVSSLWNMPPYLQSFSLLLP